MRDTAFWLISRSDNARINAESNGVLKDVLVDASIGTAVGTGIGALAEVGLVMANVSLFVAAPCSRRSCQWVGG